jgi:hypothetical protein
MDDRGQQRKVKHRLAVIRHAQEVTGGRPVNSHVKAGSRLPGVGWWHYPVCV